MADYMKLPMTVRNNLTAFEAALVCAAGGIGPRRLAAMGGLKFEWGWTAGMVYDQHDQAEGFVKAHPDVAKMFATAVESFLPTVGPSAGRAPAVKDHLQTAAEMCNGIIDNARYWTNEQIQAHAQQILLEINKGARARDVDLADLQGTIDEGDTEEPGQAKQTRKWLKTPLTFSVHANNHDVPPAIVMTGPEPHDDNERLQMATLELPGMTVGTAGELVDLLNDTISRNVIR